MKIKDRTILGFLPILVLAIPMISCPIKESAIELGLCVSIVVPVAMILYAIFRHFMAA